MPTKTPLAVVKQILKARWRRRPGLAQIGAELGIPASTVHNVLVRARLNRLRHLDWATGEPIRRYEHDHPTIGARRRTVTWLAQRGVTIARVLSENGAAYLSNAWLDAQHPAQPDPLPCPQTNGEIERLRRTLGDGWAYARLYTPETERRHALPHWIHFSNHHRHPSAIGAPPITRLNNLRDHHPSPV